MSYLNVFDIYETTPPGICWKFAGNQQLIEVSQRPNKDTEQRFNYLKSSS